MQCLEVSCAVRPIYGSLGAKGLQRCLRGSVVCIERKAPAFQENSYLHLRVTEVIILQTAHIKATMAH
jgi:hypothetical protein